MAGVDGVFNAVMIRGNAVGDVMLYGRGAGDLPTASAVVGDVLDALAHREFPALYVSAMMPATFRIRWASRTELPPNF